jgi:hypothetical protein
MATSPNYSWPEPDNTDLVKNGALAIRTMGNAIDTTMATMTPKSTYTAKGSIAAATGASTPANLSVGNNGETLVADSSTSTGLRYTAGTVQANPVLNSAMQIWQRGTSISIAASSTFTSNYLADRWQSGSTGANQAITVSRQATGDTTNLPFIQYAMRYQRNSGQTGTGGLSLAQNFESINSIPFAGKTITYSFYARAGANYSAASSALNYNVYTGTGTDQNAFAGYTGTVTAITGTATLTTTWQRFTATATLASTATEIATVFSFTPTGTAGTNDYYEVTGVQLDISSVALPFRTYAGTFQGELAACQRYYQRFTGTAYGTYAFAYGTSITNGYVVMPLQTQLRVAPTVLDYASLALDVSGTSATAVTVLAIAQSSSAAVGMNATSTGIVVGKVYDLCNNNSTSGYIGFGAEL